jgi:anti-sigma B factor antagonist
MSEKHGGHWLEREDVGDVTIVRLKLARLSDDDAHALFKQIYSLVEDMGRHNLILNLAAVDYLPSMGLGKLVMLNRRSQVAGGRLALCQLSAAVAEVLHVTHLDELLQSCATEEQALRIFAG